MNIQNKVIIRDNHRFETGYGDYANRKVFYKKAHSDIQFKKPLEHEAYGLLRFADLTKQTQLPFKIPQFIAMNENYLVTEFIDGAPVEFLDEPPHNQQLADFFVDAFVAIDTMTRRSVKSPSKYSFPDMKGKMIWQHLRDELNACGGTMKLGEPLVTACLSWLEKNHATLEARFCHADLTEKNMLQAAEGTWYVVDYESCSESWPRWYDVVNFCYNRRMQRPELDGLMQNILARVRTASGEEKTTQQEIGYIMIVRGLSLIIEYSTYDNPEHNTDATLDDSLLARITSSLNEIVTKAEGV